MKQPIRSLNEILFNMFANEAMVKLQESQNIWAIEEGIRRLDPMQYDWKTIRAQKEHECIRGHKINAWDTYCKHSVGAGWGNDWKFCLGCMAMLLYFQKVDKLSPYASTHWDYEKERPVRVEEKK